jgi:hypothetical protein
MEVIDPDPPAPFFLSFQEEKALKQVERNGSRPPSPPTTQPHPPLTLIEPMTDVFSEHLCEQ